MPLSIAERLSALSRDFQERLKGRFVELHAVLTSLFSQPGDTDVLRELRVRVHNLAGAGATFGFEALSDYSKRVEAFLDRIVKEEKPVARPILKEIELMIGEMERLGEIDNPGKEMDANMETPENTKHRGIATKKSLFLFENDEEVVRDLTRQLGYFGYSVQRITGIDVLTDLLSDAYRQLVMVNTSVLAEDPNAQSFLHNLKFEHGDAVSFIFISEKDDFDTRLRVVRAGGDAFFLKPYDVGRLIDRIEALTAQDEKVPYHVLIVDDDPEQVAYYALVLQQAGMITSVALDPKRVISVLHEAKPELVLMDMYMPGCNGMELSSVIRQYAAFVSIPIVFLSVETDMDRQLAAIRLGGDDFLTKPIKPEHLAVSILTRAARTRNIRYFMERDSLTGLLNHTNLKENLVREVMRAGRLEAPVSFAMIDLDHFKSVNDTYGHLAGDGVLKSLSRLLQERLRRTDIIGRYGGEEFGIILLNTASETASSIMNEIRENFSRIRQQADGEEFFVTFSCGVSSFPECKEASAMNAAADYALYEAKETGRNKVVVASGYPER